MEAIENCLMRLENVGVRYGGIWRRAEEFWALEDVSFDVRRGETLGVIGSNGAGKSTLMRLLADIMRPDRGRIERGRCTAQLLSLQVGFAPTLTGRENIILGGMLLGMRRRQVLAVIDEIIEFAELGDFIDRPFGTYSSGMKARLGFAVAHKAQPDVLLIDEVLGVGDRRFRDKTRQVMIDRINSEQTVVIVSHNEETLRQHCDRLVWLHEGVSQRVGSVDEVLAEYGSASANGPRPAVTRIA